MNERQAKIERSITSISKIFNKKFNFKINPKISFSNDSNYILKQSIKDRKIIFNINNIITQEEEDKSLFWFVYCLYKFYNYDMNNEFYNLNFTLEKNLLVPLEDIIGNKEAYIFSKLFLTNIGLNFDYPSGYEDQMTTLEPKIKKFLLKIDL